MGKIFQQKNFPHQNVQGISFSKIISPAKILREIFQRAKIQGKIFQQNNVFYKNLMGKYLSKIEPLT